MSRADREADEVTLPVKRTDGDTIEDRLTANAYENILPARYLRKNADGELVENQEELFERVAKNVALAEAVFEANQHDIELTVTPDQLKPDHPRRDELAAEVFGKGTTADSDVETTLTPYNVNKFAYETVVPELEGEIRTHVEETAEAFRESMENLSFIPNSPTLMNAGDELQQLSACFVDSPADDMDDIYDTLRESAKVMQCLTEETEVFVEGNGLVSIRDVEAGDAIRQRSDGDHQFRTVEEKHAYEDRSVRTVRTEAGVEITGTPIHRLRVGEEWKSIENVGAGDELATTLDWLPARQDPTLAPVESGPQWVRSVENAEIARLHARGLSDYEVADELSVSPSTVQRRRANELDLPPNGSGGRASGRSFDEDEFERRYADGGTDAEIAAALDVTPATVQQHRNAAGHEPNGSPANEVAQPRSLTPELSTLVGLWVGDGSLHENGVRFHISRDEVLEHIRTTVRDLFDTGVSSTWAGGCYEVTINSHEVRRWWVENFGDGKPSSREANVPKVITRGGREHVAAFLSGLWTADGTLAKERYPRLDTSSPRLARQVQTLLLGLGIPASRQEVAGRDLYSVNPVSERGYKTFSELVGFVDARSRTLAESHAEADCYNRPTGRIEDGLWYQPVSAVEDAGTETVYDVTVREDPQYVANGVVSHNSGGGMGYAFWNLRPYGDTVGSSGGIASGPITFMRSYDSMCETIAQGGTRRGAQMGVMRVSHPDIIQFIHAKNKDVSLAHSLRLNDPDDFTHTRFVDALEEARELIDEEGRVPEHLRNAVEGHLSNFNISVGVTDDFMDALYADEEFTFTNPRTEEPHIATEETKELYECYGLGEHVEVGEELSIPAAELWDHIVDGAYQNGEPGVIYLERVNKEHSFDIEEYPEHEILATNPCVTGETLISTERGLIPAEELYEQGVATDVVVDGRLSDDRIKEASSVYKTGEKDVFELSTEEGYELRLTAEHRVMTDDGWVEAQNLDAGDTVHIANRKGVFGQHGTAEEGKILGWLIGDGHLKHGEERAVLNFYDEDCEISDEFAGYVNDVVREPVGNANYEVGVSQIQRADDYRGIEAREERIRSTRLYELAEQAGLVEHKHQIPDSVFQGSETMARGFLQALFTADGSVQGTREKGFSVRLSSSERGLLTDVQRLLLNFGIPSKIYENRRDAGRRELPDGNGGTKEYEVKAQHELVISGANLVTFEEEIGFLLDYKNDALGERLDSYGRGPYLSKFEATVKSVDYDGHEAVYDLTEPNTNSFIGNGLVIHNCGEQPLEEYEACNLGHINLSTLAATDAPDWRVWSDKHESEFDSREAAMDAYLDEAIDFEAFDRRIELGTRFLENVVTMSDFPVGKIEQKVREMRKIGLGVMGLAQLYIQLGVRYGSEEGNEIARQLMTHINHGSKRASHELAGERGSFEDWEDSKYANPTEYREWFETQTGESADDWEDGFPIRNHNTTTIAPTGTTSMVGNTTGGCEPIYNVAYYKNVSDDVQGDEMLVEFDDYFLRVLEANDIDVDAVKEEAQEQMSSNEFDGVEGLETVPNAIGELFVVTADLSGKDHAAVQCACQAGVDSAISKTCNFPNSATKEDMDEVYRYIYDNGGKGVTVYRDGTRSKQVLTTRADNAEFADEGEAATVIAEQIEEVFGSIEGFLDSEDVRAALDADLESVISEPVYAEKQPRPDVLHGVTQRVDTGYGKLYVNINEDESGRPFELFANIGHSGGFTNSFTEALAKVISTALRSGVDPEEIVDELNGTRSPKVAWDKGEQIQSIPDAIGTAMRRYLDGEIEKTYPQQRNLAEIADEDDTGETEPKPDGSGAAQPTNDHQQLIDNGENPECPSCGALALYYSEGCKTCESCGWSEC